MHKTPHLHRPKNNGIPLVYTSQRINLVLFTNGGSHVSFVIYNKRGKSFHVRFPNIMVMSYKLPLVQIQTADNFALNS